MMLKKKVTKKIIEIEIEIEIEVEVEMQQQKLQEMNIQSYNKGYKK